MIDDGLEPVEVTGRPTLGQLGRTMVGYPESRAVSRKSDSRRLPYRHGGRCSTGTIVVVSVERRV